MRLPERFGLKQQYAALPWRARGDLEIMLISSRETKRWIIPKGWPSRKLEPHEAAKREAFEEACIGGEISSESFGYYHYVKRLAQGSLQPCRVDVFAMRVTNQLKTWPERHERETRWFSPEEAAQAVMERDLSDLILSFADSALNHSKRRTFARMVNQ